MTTALYLPEENIGKRKNERTRGLNEAADLCEKSK